MVRPLMTSGYHHGFDGVIISSTIAIMQINGFCLLASLAFSSNGRFQHRMQTRLCAEASGVEDMSKENDKLTGTATTIYFIRHAETKENVRMRSLLQAGKSIVKFQYPTTRDIKNGLKFVSTSFLGMNDSVLTEKGQQQVRHLTSITSSKSKSSQCSQFWRFLSFSLCACLCACSIGSRTGTDSARQWLLGYGRRRCALTVDTSQGNLLGCLVRV